MHRISVFVTFFAVFYASLFSSTAVAKQCGSASWYALKSKTASGEYMNPDAFTGAHRKFPFGTKLKVTNQRNGRSVVIRINDRGPFIKGRMIDLSKAAAIRLGYLDRGHTRVCIEKIS